MGTSATLKQRSIFVTGTDTGVGKTLAALALGLLFQKRGYDVGYMKPVQCGGNDSELLKMHLDLKEDIRKINPYFAREPLSPNVAFARQKIKVNLKKIMDTFESLRKRHDILIVEGAGGLLVPIQKNYCVIDLMKEMGSDVVVVARLGLGTINHCLLTVRQIKEAGLNLKGVLFTQTGPEPLGIAEQTNPDIVRILGDVPILGKIPYLKNMSPPEIINQCRDAVNIDAVLRPLRNSTKRLAKEDHQYLWHPFTQMRDWIKEEPLIIEHAQGSYLTDTNGNRYLDGVSSLWVNVHGHGHPVIDREIKDQINRLSHSTMLGLSNAPAIHLARELISVVPKGLTKVFYSDNGSTSVEIAIKMAYQYWQNMGNTDKTGIVHLANSYHGDTLGSVSVGGIDLFHKVYGGLTFKTIQLDFPDCYRAPKGKQYPDFAFESVDKLEVFLKKKSRFIAAMVIEPIVQGAAGMIVWPPGILKKFAQLCRKYDVLLIADEVATGFGRTGKMFACDHEGVTPDILCVAKGLTAGYLPLAATLTNERIFKGFLFDYESQKTFFHGHTYTGNPIACAAALANLRIFKKEQTLKKLQSKIKHLCERLRMFYNLAHVGDVRQRGFMVGIELVTDKKSKTPYPWAQKIGIQVCQLARKRGVILRPLGHVIVLMPPLSISKDELDELCNVTYEAIQQTTEKRM